MITIFDFLEQIKNEQGEDIVENREKGLFTTYKTSQKVFENYCKRMNVDANTRTRICNKDIIDKNVVTLWA